MFPSFGTRAETVFSQPEERFFNGRLAFQKSGEIETQEIAVVLLPQEKEEEPVQLLEIQNQPAVTTITIANEPVAQGQQTTLVVPPPNEPGVQGVGTLIVTTLVDENDGGSGGTGLSLREAILMASDGDTIIFDPSLNNGTTTDRGITLSLGELVIDKSLNIDGDLDGDDSTRDITVDGDGNGRVFRIDDGDDDNQSAVSLDGLEITGGFASGTFGQSMRGREGGIYNNNEFLRLSNSTISGNEATSRGGGISNNGTLEVNSSIISSNDGQGVFNYNGIAKIINSTISSNDGHGVLNSNNGSAEIINSTISSNDGAGISNGRGSAEIINSSISDNLYQGINNLFGTAKITNSTITGNSANDGGGVLNSYGTLEIISSTVSDNSARKGGGIFNNGGSARINNSTISGNSASEGGGIQNESYFYVYGYELASLEITNSTVSSNSSRGNGGGIYNSRGRARVINSTISGNSSSRNGGGIQNSTIYFDARNLSLTLSNSLISGNTANNRGNEIFNVASSMLSANANNLFGDNSQTDNIAFSNFSPGNNDINATSDGINIALDNILDPSLANNGGSTLTHSLVAGSPAIDAGSNPLELTTDQRGFDREFDGNRDGNSISDIGAFELQQFQAGAEIQVTLPDGTTADGIDDIRFGTPLSLFRDNTIDSDLTRPNFADTFQFIDITNIDDEEILSIFSIDINVPGVSVIPQGDFLLNPGRN